VEQDGSSARDLFSPLQPHEDGDRLVFGAFAADLTETNTYEYTDFSLARFAHDAIRFDGGKMSVEGGILRGECKALMADAVYWSVE